ncbi:MAG: hypothetical protein FE045_05270 [Thermoplasmata archaeon]|nr:MAG: hypothetical protein FE045_05270 [Thermoplasmata archaeon]
MRNVVLDTNALLLPYQLGMNIEKELTRLLGICRIIVPTSVIKEAEKLASSNGSVAMAAKLGLNIVRKRDYQIVETLYDGDDGVMDVAVKTNAAIVTNDKELKKKAKEMGLPVIYVRGESRLEIEESL